MYDSAHGEGASTSSADPSYFDRLETFRRADKERDHLLEELIRDYEHAQKELITLREDYDHEQETRRELKTQVQKFKKERAALNADAFAVAFIDGDGALFNDEFFKNVDNGGAEAAALLHAGLSTHLKGIYDADNVGKWQIVVNVYLNLSGLASKMKYCGLIDFPTQMADFGRSFGLSKPLFNFIDVGPGKERADHKLKETFRFYWPNAQCKHIFFGPCHDNGYLPFLEQYRYGEASSRITLIETRPAEQGFRNLGLRRIQMTDVFRSEDLGSKSTIPVANGSGESDESTIPNSNREPAWKSPATSPPKPVATIVAQNPVTYNIAPAPPAASGKKYLLRNDNNQRIDPKLPPPDANAMTAFTKRIEHVKSLCNNYHINGSCSFQKCTHDHGKKLTDPERLVLRHKARGLPCPYGSDCVNLECVLGHHCHNPPGQCWFKPCKFASTHGMDLRVVKRIDENGTSESRLMV